MTADELPTGYFGKIACRGDFVSHGLSDGFVSRWDDWLAPCLHQLGERLGDAWLELYLTSPILRFALPGRLFGHGVMGILMPSVDRVGRYYPLTLAAELLPGQGAVAPAMAALDWFEGLEATALATLDDEPLSVEDLRGRLAALPAPMEAAVPERGEGARQLAGALAAWVAPRRDDRGLWWVGESYRFAMPAGLPDAELLAWLMGGGRAGHASAPAGRQSAVDDGALRAAGRCETGHLRDANQDAILVDPHRDLYVVADGMGGHLDGARASGMLVDALERLELEGSLPSRVEAVRGCIERVNRELHDFGAAAGDVCGATVAALVLADGRFAILWAGDSRVYRSSGSGVVEQLSIDHADAGDEVGGVSRAVGADASIVLEERVGETADTDRFLLCSDGVYRHVDVDTWLSSRGRLSPAELADATVAEVLRGVADDNLSVIVVDPLVR